MSQSSDPREFDVFLSHNSTDKPIVREVKERLVARSVSVWYDEDELRPGIPWQQLLEAGIKHSRSAAVLVGDSGLGPWEREEMRAALLLAVEDKRPVIPVLLPHATQPELPMFLRGRTWVDLRAGLSDAGLNSLIWGITGVKPATGGTAEVKPAVPDARSTRRVKAKPPPLPPPNAGFDEVEDDDDVDDDDESGASTGATESVPPFGLADIVPGAWQVQIQTPFAVGHMRLQLVSGGMFQGELATPMGMSAVNGQWQVNPFAGQIALQGQQTNGFQTIPYLALVQVRQFDRQRIIGMTSAGEQVFWQRVGG